jgi:hypothetical protein
VTPGQRVINEDYEHPTGFKLQEMSTDWLEYYIPTLKVRIETGNDGSPNSGAIKGLLEPFRTVAYGLQKVQVLNTGSNPELKEYVGDLTKAMSPRCIWTNALVWNYLEIMRALKTEADELVNAGHLQQARIRYFDVTYWYGDGALAWLQPAAYTPEVAEVVAMLYRIVIMCAIIINAIYIRWQIFNSKDYTDVLKWISTAMKHMAIIPGRQRLPDSLTVAISWSAVLSRLVLDPTEESLRLAKMKLQTHILPRAEDPILYYANHDLAVIEKYLKGEDVSPPMSACRV